MTISGPSIRIEASEQADAVRAEEDGAFRVAVQREMDEAMREWGDPKETNEAAAGMKRESNDPWWLGAFPGCSRDDIWEAGMHLLVLIVTVATVAGFLCWGRP